MKRNRIVGMLAVGVVGSLLTFTSAARADDTTVLINNIPATVDQIVVSAQTIVTTYQTTQSADQTFQQLIFEMNNIGSALGSGTVQYGSLGLGLAFMGIGFYGVLQPYLLALDDPSTAGGLFDPNDLSLMLSQLPAGVAAAQPYAVSAVAEALRGNLIFGDTLFSALNSPAVAGDSLQVPRQLLDVTTAGTNYDQVGLLTSLTVGVPLLAVAGNIQTLETALAPAFTALGPVTEPVIAVLTGA